MESQPNNQVSSIRFNQYFKNYPQECDSPDCFPKSSNLPFRDFPESESLALPLLLVLTHICVVETPNNQESRKIVVTLCWIGELLLIYMSLCFMLTSEREVKRFFVILFCVKIC